MEEFLAGEFQKLQRGLVATPETRENLEAFAKSNQGSMDLVLMQMAIQFGYKIALENVQEELQRVTQMAEQDIKGKWTLRAPKNIPKSSLPMLGMVYEGTNKFFGGQVVGILIQLHQENDEAVLQMKGNSLVSVDIKTLKIVVSS